MKHLKIFIILFGLILFSSTVLSQGDIPKVIPFQFVLYNLGGGVISSGNYDVGFLIYDANSGGTLQDWSECWCGANALTPDSNGRININIGELNPINLNFDTNFFLDVNINNEGPSTRYRIPSTASAYTAENISGNLDMNGTIVTVFDVNILTQANILDINAGRDLNVVRDANIGQDLNIGRNLTTGNDLNVIGKTMSMGDLNGESNSSFGIAPNFTQIEADGGLLFYGSSGLAFGEIYVKDNTDTTTLNSAAKVQITDFANNGESNNMTPDHTNDHITVNKAGKYLITVAIAVFNNAAQSHIINIGLFKNNGDTQFNNVHGHRSLSGGSGDIGSMVASGIIDVAATDTIELWANTDTAADRDVTFEDVTLTAVLVGGT